MISVLKKGVKLLNDFTITIVFILFYIAIIPFGKLIFLVNSLFKKEDPNTYWQKPDGRELDLDSPY
jgi:hypothetical protein